MRNIFSPPVLASKTSWPLPAISLPPQLLSRLNEPNQFNHEARGGRAPEVYSAKILAAFRLCVSAPRQMCEVGARRGGGRGGGEKPVRPLVGSVGTTLENGNFETSKTRDKVVIIHISSRGTIGLWTTSGWRVKHGGHVLEDRGARITQLERFEFVEKTKLS